MRQLPLPEPLLVGQRCLLRSWEPGDAPALADAIRELASDPSRRRRLGDNARQLVTREFSDDVVGEQTARLYRQLLETAAQ